MCMKNINALGVIILFFSAFIGECQSRKRDRLKHEKSVSYETGDTSSNSKEDMGSNIKDSAAKTLLQSKKYYESSTDEEIINDSHRNVDNADQDFAKKTYLIDKESNSEDEIIRGNPKKILNVDIDTNLKNLETKILNTKDSTETSQEEIITGGLILHSNEDQEPKYEASAPNTHLNLKYTKKSSREVKVIKGSPKLFKQRLPWKQIIDFQGTTDFNLDDSKESFREDENIRLDAKTKFNKRIAPKHKVLATETTLNPGDTTELSEKDEKVRGKHKKHENPEAEEKVLTIHLTNEQSKRNKDQKKNSRQWTPLPVIIRTDKGKKNNSKKPISYESSLEDEKAIQKDIMKAKALRKAYGDACTRVVVRKCLKAMKATLKEVCKSSGRKCKSNFKEDFKENSVTGCYNQFNNKSSFRVGNQGSMENGAQPEDNTRELSMTYVIRTLSNTTQEIKTWDKSKPIDAEISNINVLRDRYEKACQKASYGKCREAGKYAMDETCEKHECTSTKKKAIKVTYKKQCRNVYGIKRSSDSSSSSSASSASD